MVDPPNTDKFEDIVEWAYSTLPSKIRDLPDFPGIQVVDEPPEEMTKRRKQRPGTELLGCYARISRTGLSFTRIPITPDLIFVFRGPILRCSRGNLPAEVKNVVWHEVAHWLGHNEEDIRELGL
jgi:predicted Zn-dependent protease with MMP-like domain